MRRLRSVIFWCHLPLGIAAGAVVVIMSATGVLLTYQKQMQYWADASAFRTAPPAGAQMLPVASLLDAVRGGEIESAPSAITFRRDAAEPVAITAGTRTMYVNPYSGELYGEGRGQRMRAFFTSVTGWHRWLAMDGARRTTGRWFTGAANLMFLFILLTGLYLWWPRRWTWAQFRNALWFRGGGSSKARDFNWHHVLGIWSAVPLIVIVSGGVVISYPWASDLVYRAMGEAPPPRPAARAGGRSAGTVAGAAGRTAGRGDAIAAASRPADTANAIQRERPPSAPLAADAPLDDLVARAQARVPDWQLITMRLPERRGPIAFTIDRGTPGQPQKRATFTIDPVHPGSEKWETFSDQTPGRQARSWLRFLHTGEAFGLAGQTVAGIVSAAAVVLTYTGMALSFRRFFRRGRARQDSARV